MLSHLRAILDRLQLIADPFLDLNISAGPLAKSSIDYLAMRRRVFPSHVPPEARGERQCTPSDPLTYFDVAIGELSAHCSSDLLECRAYLTAVDVLPFRNREINF
jgi:hypothetical protein